jgi:hypothetical protein
MTSVLIRDKGWFESDYFYPTRLGLLKKAAGCLFDWIAARTTKERKSESELSLAQPVLIR